jgi:hypothetical protein
VTAVLLSLDDLGPGGDSPNWEALQIVAEAAV